MTAGVETPGTNAHTRTLPAAGDEVGEASGEAAVRSGVAEGECCGLEVRVGAEGESVTAVRVALGNGEGVARQLAKGCWTKLHASSSTAAAASDNHRRVRCLCIIR